MIKRYTKNGHAYWCKTDRRYGAATRHILAVAATGVAFTRTDLKLPHETARNRLWKLAREGKLCIMRPGINGPHGRPPVYQMNDQAEQ